MAYPNPLPFPSCLPSNLAAPSHDRFYFPNSLSLFSKYKYIFLEWFTYPPPPLNHTRYFGLDSLTTHQPLFVFCYNQLQHLFPCIFIFGLCLTPPPTHTHHILSQDDVKAMKTDVAHNIFKRIWSVPQQSGEPYATSRETGNLYWETGSVYFYLINVNLLRH